MASAVKDNSGKGTRGETTQDTTTPAQQTPVKEARPGYGQLLRTPGAWAFLLPGFLARQPFAMLTFSILLLVQHTTGSYGTAGVVSAVTGVSMALFAPQSGKLADRFGQRAVLVPGVLVHAAAVTAMITLALSHAPLWALLVIAVPTGASTPQIGPMVRSRWAAKLTGTPLMPTSTAFESVTDEFTFVIGSVLATALCTGIHPAAGLIAEGALTLGGGLLFAAQRRSQPPVHRSADSSAKRVSALSVPGLRVLIAALFGIGTVFGGMQVSLTAFTEDIGQPGINGLLYGVFAAGNMLAGIVCGAIAWKVGPRRRLLVAYALLALMTTPLWAVAAAPLMGAVGLLVGLCIAPALITGYTLIDSLVPATARTEAFTWLTGAVGLGQAAASTVAGLMADHFGPHAGFLVPLCGTGLALVVLAVFRGHLVPRSETRVVGRGVGHRTPATVD